MTSRVPMVSLERARELGEVMGTPALALPDEGVDEIYGLRAGMVIAGTAVPRTALLLAGLFGGGEAWGLCRE
jgi:hypothetical protein